MHPACPDKKQNHLQNSFLRRAQFWVRKTFSKPASLKRASLVPPPGIEVPDQQREVYEPLAGGETFAQQRARHARQESLLFRPQQPGAPAYGPQRPAEPRPTPYSEEPLSRDDALNATIDIDLLKENNLPTGWHLDKTRA